MTAAHRNRPGEPPGASIVAPMRSAAVLCLLVAALLAGPAVATAQERGVTVDPDSPAGREYALPFEAARREAAADPAVEGRRISPAAQTAPPFGVGIEPSGRGGGRSRSGADGSDNRRAGSADAARKAGTASAAVVESDLSTSLTIIALSLLVLLAGSLLGFVIGRSSRGGSDA